MPAHFITARAEDGRGAGSCASVSPPRGGRGPRDAGAPHRAGAVRVRGAPALFRLGQPLVPALPSAFTGMRKSRPLRNVLTYTAPSARSATTVDRRELRISDPHLERRCAGPEPVDAIAETIRSRTRCDPTATRHVVAHAAVAWERIRALGCTALQVEGSQGCLPHDRRAAAPAGVVLADPQGVGLVIREHAEDVAQASG